MMPIAIPTYCREDRQFAYRSMPGPIQARTTLFTHSGRAGLLQAKHPRARIANLGPTDGIADVRQKLLEAIAIQGHTKVIIIDDGCKLFTSEVVGGARKAASKSIRGEAATSTWETMLYTVEDALDEFAQVGISARPGNNRHAGSWQTPGRAYSCYGLNLKTLWDHGIRFDGMYQRDPRIKLYEDFYLTLSLLTRGLPNTVWYDYCFQCDHGKPGGNNIHRTNELQRLCVESLHAHFPRFVKIVQRKAVAWKLHGDEQFRWECIVSWKKALQCAL